MQQDVYEIRVKGRLGDSLWSQWFEDMTVTAAEGGVTILTGPVTDQAALYGLLFKLRDLALPLLSIILLEETAEKPIAE